MPILTQFIRVGLFALIVAILSACSTKKISTPVETAAPASSQMQDPEYLLALSVQQSNPELKNRYLLGAANLYWQNQLYTQSKAALTEIDPRYLNSQDWQTYWLRQLELALLESNQEAIRQSLPNVHQPDFFNRDVDSQRALTLTLVEAYKSIDQRLEAAILLIESSGLMSDDMTLNEQVWQLLRSSSLVALGEYQPTEENYDIQGWLELAKEIRLRNHQLQDQYNALQRWLNLWPIHPAAIEPPKELVLLNELPETRPKHIVLALPFSGPLAAVGHAIRDGILASYYAEHAVEPSPNETGSANGTAMDNQLGTEIEIRSFDTHAQDFFSLYDGSLPEGSIIIGPLKKETLTELSQYDALPIRTLALNYIENDRSIPNLFQFSLNPEFETAQIADRMTEDGIKRIGILAPENDWGLRVYDSFVKANIELDNMIVESAFYSDQKSLSNAVARMLATDKSKQRARNIRRITGLRLESTPRRRQDVQGVFMVARPGIAKQLKPMLAYHYAQDLPVYATSQINDLHDTERQPDLNGIRFVDMPWSLSSTVALRNMLEEQFPQSANRYSRFYAMGVDAYQIAPRIEILTQVDESHIEGQTGQLSIGENNAVQRTLQWAQFRSGKPVIIN